MMEDDDIRKISQAPESPEASLGVKTRGSG